MFSYDTIKKWLEAYFQAYNAYAQNPDTVARMNDYFSPDVHFIPYVSAFGGPGNAVTNRNDFYRMFTSHPEVYEQFEVDNIIIDEKQMVAVALLDVSLYESATNKVLLRKHYLPRYQLIVDNENTLKISTIHFFWEATPPEADEAYRIK